MAKHTSGGTPLSHARLAAALQGLPVRPAFTARDAPYCWRIEHVLDRARQFHPHNLLDDHAFEAQRAPAIEQAAAALTAAGYTVTLRLVPDDAMLDALPTSLRAQVADTVRTLQCVIVPDDPVT